MVGLRIAPQVELVGSADPLNVEYKRKREVREGLRFLARAIGGMELRLSEMEKTWGGAGLRAQEFRVGSVACETPVGNQVEC